MFISQSEFRFVRSWGLTEKQDNLVSLRMAVNAHINSKRDQK